MCSLYSVVLNGKVIAAEKAFLSISDRGFLLADGAFETIQCLNGKPLFLKQHWQRLQQGLATLSIETSWDFAKVKFHIEQVLQLNQLTQKFAGVRLTISRGNSSRGLATTNAFKPTFLLVPFSLVKDDKPWSLVVSKVLRNQHSCLSSFKSLAYTENIIAKHNAMQQGADDAIMLNIDKQVCCSTISNIFYVKNNKLHTPSLSCGPVAGITRQIVIDLATNNGIACSESTFAMKDLLAADEVFLTNSLMDIKPIKQIDQHTFDINHTSLSKKIAQLYQSHITESLNGLE